MAKISNDCNKYNISNTVQKAWDIRGKTDSRIWFSAPGFKHYQSRQFSNQPNSFANLSITGSRCECKCEHCNAGLLKSMLPAETPDRLRSIVDCLVERGCRGILVSGGADSRGVVQLEKFMGVIRYARYRGLKVLVHTGILDKRTAVRLKDSGVDQVLLDIIGHELTINKVYHLHRTPEDYLRAMMNCREAGLDFVPHVVVGLHFGEILGEYNALKMIRKAGADKIALIVLTPTTGTGMSQISPPRLPVVAEVFAAARLRNPDSFLSLGCAKPTGEYRRQVEILAIDCGFNGIAFPSDAAIDHACSRGMHPVFTEECCSMAGSVCIEQPLCTG